MDLLYNSSQNVCIKEICKLKYELNSWAKLSNLNGEPELLAELYTELEQVN